MPPHRDLLQSKTQPERPPERRSGNTIGWLTGGIVGALLLFGLFALLLASVAGWFLVGGATTRYTDTATKTFTVATPVTLTIQNPAGNVTIRQGKRQSGDGAGDEGRAHAQPERRDA